MKELFTKKFWHEVKKTYEDARSGKDEATSEPPPVPPLKPAAPPQPDPPLPPTE